MDFYLWNQTHIQTVQLLTVRKRKSKNHGIKHVGAYSVMKKDKKN